MDNSVRRKGVWRTSLAGIFLNVAAVLTVTLTILPVARLSAQEQPFSSTSEYKSMLEELHRDPSRPSRMSAGNLLETAQPPTDLKVEEDTAALVLETSGWRLEVAKSHWRMALKNKQTGLTWQLTNPDNSSGGIHWAQSAGSAAAPRLGKVESVERSGDSWRMQVEVAGSAEPASLEVTVISPTVIRLSIRAPQSLASTRMEMNFSGAGPFFGLGERFDRVKLDGLSTVLRPEDWLGKPGHNWTYIPIPFLFTPRGLGIYLDTSAVSSFDLSQAQEDKFSVQLENSSVDAYLFAGEPKAILGDYSSLTGRSSVPPPWAFGVWICSYQGPDKVLDDARRLRKDDIPASAIWTFDVMDEGGIMGWPLWWTGYYPHPRQFTDQLHGMGFKALTYVHPYLRSALDPYNLPNPSFVQGEKSRLLVTDPQGKPTGPAFEPFLDGNIDFTSPANVDWWEQKIRNILLDDNFDGWMEDYGEWINDTDRFAAGVTGKKMANLNSLFYHKITYEIARKAKPDVVEFVRSGYAGSQGYTRVVWGGDQFPNWTQDYGLPSVVRAGITAGMAGYAVWGPDIAENGHSKELWTRWTEFGALTPVMRDHMWDKPEGAVNLWYDAETLDTFRRYARLHISLFPYFYTYANQAARTGMPVMRHLLLEYPDDAKTYDCDAEYLLGDKILVAPVIEQGALNRTLYLPQGFWTNYWTGEVMAGGREVTIPAPLQQIPILVQSGSVLPFISPETETLAQDLAGNRYRTFGGDLTWRVFPAAGPVQGNFTLYDGTVAKATQEASRIEVTVQSSPAVRNYEVSVPEAQTPAKVTLDGKLLSKVDDASSAEGKKGWRMDADGHELHVFLNARDFDLNVYK